MILVFIEHREGKIKKSSLEVLSEAGRQAARLKTDVSAAMVGFHLESMSRDVLDCGAGKLFLLENENLALYSSDAYASVLADFALDIKPEGILFSASSMGKDLAPRLAAKLHVSFASDCVGISAENGQWQFTRPVFAGKALMTIRLKTIPFIASLRPNVFSLAALQPDEGMTEKRSVDHSLSRGSCRVVEIIREKGQDLDVTEADVVISGGRGMKGPENFDLLKELASVIPNAAVGASRSAVDSGWIDHQHQVGQTGKTVSPNLYMAFGISGAIQHLAGMSSSKHIVAVNKDPDAPIFKVADYGIVGDLFQIIPQLKEEFKRMLSE